MDDLTAAVIQAGLGPGVDVTVLPRVTSTNTYVRQHGSTQPQLVVAETQTAGRGRGTHRFLSPQGNGLYLSVSAVWQYATTATIGQLMAQMGVAVVTAVAQVTGLTLELKWPNDLFWHHQKRGGILLERVDTATATQMIVGLGLDMTVVAQSSLTAPITAAMTPRHDWTRNELITRLTQEILSVLAAPIRDWQARYLAVCLWLEAAVEVYTGQSYQQGNLRGIDAQGRLLLATRNGIDALEPERVHGLRPI